MHTLTRLAFKHSYSTQQLEQVFLLIFINLEGEFHLTLIKMIYSLEPTQTLHHQVNLNPFVFALNHSSTATTKWLPQLPIQPYHHSSQQ